jgi:hypothetical protein
MFDYAVSLFVQIHPGERIFPGDKLYCFSLVTLCLLFFIVIEFDLK